MQNEEKAKRKSPYRVLQQRKMEEDRNWENLPEIDISYYSLKNRIIRFIKKLLGLK